MSAGPTHRSVDLGEDPDVLGAAATLPVERGRRSGTTRRRTRTRKRTAPTRLEGYSGTVYVFEPGSRPTEPLRDYLARVWERRAFITGMARAEVRGPRANTALGQLWALLDPLFSASVYYFLFVVIRGGRGRPVEFLPVLIAGVFLFSLTTGALSDGGRSIRRSRGLMLNSAFPRAILPLVSIYKGLLSFGSSALVIAVALLALGEPNGELLYFPVVFAIQLVMDVGLALLTATLIVFFRDASNVLNYVVRLLFFATPVIYPATILPESTRHVLEWMPLYPVFASYQAIFGDALVDLGLLARGAVWAVVVLAGGLAFFRRHEHEFASKL